MSFRFGVFCAVSTKEQASSDKFSLSDQESRCRKAGLDKGWVEVSKYIVSGQSRTKYIELSEAMKEIEPLRQMIQDARAGKFDIVIVSEFDRFRDLLDQVFRTLARFSVQLYSLAQPVEPVPRNEYSVYHADSIVLSISLSQTFSRLEISRTRRKYSENMPKRITELGLPATGLPFGYRKPPGHQFDRKAIPEPDPILAPHIIALKDLHLAGHSTSELVDYLEDHNVPPPKGAQWYPQSVRDILKNAFYAGVVQFGKSKVYIDPKTDTRKRNRKIPLEEVRQNTGKHTPLWDGPTHQAILREFHRRAKSYRGRVNNEFTGLVRCGVCGASMWRQGNGPREHRLIWRCSSTGSANGHCNFLHDILLEKVKEQLPAVLQQSPPAAEPKTSFDEKKLRELERQLTRLEDAYLAGEWDLNRYTQRKALILSQMQEQQETVLDRQRKQEERAAWVETVRDMAEIDYSEWFTKDAGEINHTLHMLVKAIVIYPDRIELEPRFASSG